MTLLKGDLSLYNYARLGSRETRTKKIASKLFSELRGDFKVPFRACPTLGGGLGVILFFPQMIHIFQCFSVGFGNHFPNKQS